MTTLIRKQNAGAAPVAPESVEEDVLGVSLAGDADIYVATLRDGRRAHGWSRAEAIAAARAAVPEA